MPSVREPRDWIVSCLLVVGVGAIAIFLVNFNIPPFEDAAMLMRYADHLAHGFGIVWNIGEHPVDGATDFLFMATVAGLMKLGLPLGRAVRGLGLGSVLGLVLLVYWVNRRLWQSPRLVALLSALYLALGTGLTYVAVYFGTPFFALFAAVTWTFALLLMHLEKPSVWLSLGFAICGLISGLIRPEGAILAGLMLLAVISQTGWRASARTILIFCGVFALLGGAYFSWHWSYFGYPLPNAFYKKGGGSLHWDSLLASWANLAWLGGPFLLAYLLGLRSAASAWRSMAFLIPVVGFASAFVLISNETNFGARFQFALLPIVLLSWFPLVGGLGRELNVPDASRQPLRGRLVLWAVLAALCGLLLYAAYRQAASLDYARDGRYDLAQALQPFAGRGYTMATSEAGLLPLYSQWRAVDTWGLNDEWIAHQGSLSSAYLDRYAPELIIFHAHFSPLAPPTTPDHYPDPAWFAMTLTLKQYAESHHYILAAVYGVSPYDTHYYYVRPDFADSQEIVRLISRFTPYAWAADGGMKAVNYVVYAGR